MYCLWYRLKDVFLSFSFPKKKKKGEEEDGEEEEISVALPMDSLLTNWFPQKR